MINIFVKVSLFEEEKEIGGGGSVRYRETRQGRPCYNRPWLAVTVQSVNMWGPSWAIPAIPSPAVVSKDGLEPGGVRRGNQQFACFYFFVHSSSVFVLKRPQLNGAIRRNTLTYSDKWINKSNMCPPYQVPITLYTISKAKNRRQKTLSHLPLSKFEMGWSYQEIFWRPANWNDNKCNKCMVSRGVQRKKRENQLHWIGP